MIALFLILWVALFGLAAFAIAAVPTTEPKPNSMLIGPAIATGVVSALVTLVVSGVANLFT